MAEIQQEIHAPLPTPKPKVLCCADSDDDEDDPVESFLRARYDSDEEVYAAAKAVNADMMEYDSHPRSGGARSPSPLPSNGGRRGDGRAARREWEQGRGAGGEDDATAAGGSPAEAPATHAGSPTLLLGTGLLTAN